MSHSTSYALKIDTFRMQIESYHWLFLIFACITIIFQYWIIFDVGPYLLKHGDYNISADMPVHYMWTFDRYNYHLEVDKILQFPFFYSINAVVAKLNRYLFGVSNLFKGIQIVWFMHAFIRVAGIYFLLLTLQQIFTEKWIVGLLLSIIVTSPPLFFNYINWNQNEYVFFASILCFYFTVKWIYRGTTLSEFFWIGVICGLGLRFKITMLLPFAATLFSLFLLNRYKSKFKQKILGCLIILSTFTILNLDNVSIIFNQIFASSQILDQYQGMYVTNGEHFLEQFLSFDFRVFLVPPPKLFLFFEKPITLNITTTSFLQFFRGILPLT